MSDDLAIQLKGVGKLYRMYESLTDRVLGAAKLEWVCPWRKAKYHDFWALRNIDLELNKGERLGLIGRNGAGKTTLLKLITGNYPPTEGSVKVKGNVQALMDVGSGFHPEFTGRENAIASLELLGLKDAEIEEALEDISRFTELGHFFDQPFKNYSAGMKARLAFATATCIKPELLIIDEVLGAGDGYFAFKSAERMKELAMESGATILLVSHDLNAVLRYCDKCIWIDRGKIVEKGASREVVKSYESYLRRLEENRTKARNKKAMRGASSYEESEGYGCRMEFRFNVAEGEEMKIQKIEVDYLDEKVSLLVGGAQDTDSKHSTFVNGENSYWSDPQTIDGLNYRTLRKPENRGVCEGWNHATMCLWNSPSAHAAKVSVTYAMSGPTGDVEISISGDLENTQPMNFKLTKKGSGFQTEGFEYDFLQKDSRRNSPEEKKVAGESKSECKVSRWTGTGEVTIDEISFNGPDGIEVASFDYGDDAVIQLSCRVLNRAITSAIPAILVFTLDGIEVTKFIGEKIDLREAVKGQVTIDLVMKDLRLQNGRYVVTAALYRTLDVEGVTPSDYFCVLDKSAEFSVSGVKLIESALYGQGADWRYCVS